MHVVDLFADRDTHACARSAARVRPGPQGFDREALCAAIERVGARDRIAGVVAGSGFEQDPTLLDALPAGAELLGNAAEIVRTVKEPAIFFGALSRLGIPYPETRSSPAGDSRGWLRKRIGGSGGMHVLPLGADGQCPPGYFLQRAVAGRVHSVVFAANGRRAAIVGYNAIWQEPGRFTYRGAIADRSLPARVRTDLAEVVPELTAAFGLRGLCGADFIVDDDERWTLLEINPRPTASFELHERDGGLFTVHVDACRGRLPVRIGATKTRSPRCGFSTRRMRCGSHGHGPAGAVIGRQRVRGCARASRSARCTQRGVSRALSLASWIPVVKSCWRCLQRARNGAMA